MNIRYNSVEDEFLPLIEKAKLEMSKRKNFNNGQIIVMLSSKGNLYFAIITDICTMCEPDRDIALLEELSQVNDAHIEKLICMWAGGGFDIPSYTFRKKLCAINEKNSNAEMLLCSENVYIKKTIAESF